MKPILLLGILLKSAIVPLPWPLKRLLLQRFFGYQLDRTARIRLAWIFPKHLRMSEGSLIDHFSVVVNLDYLELGEQAIIGRRNWITAFPTGTASPHFSHQHTRCAELLLGAHASITSRHHIDATNRITIGAFSTIAGYNSQFLSHSIDLFHNRQNSEPITIGSYCFVGTNCVVLGGSQLPDYCVLGALSLLNKSLNTPWSLYAGQPARQIKLIDQTAAYFNRNEGYVT